ncbi:MAG: cytochrome P450 [Pseudomonadota bacterium]
MFDGKRLSDGAFMRNPAPVIAELREIGEVVETRIPIVGCVWIAVSHDLAGRVLKEQDNFSIRKDGKVAGLQWWMPGIFRALANNMLTVDEPDHKRLRSIVDEAFRRQAILDMEPHIEGIAEGMAKALFQGGEPADLVSAYARQLPLAVICEMLGLPSEDRPKFTRWASGLTSVNGILGFIKLVPGLRAMKRYIEYRIREAEKNGGDGLIAELVSAKANGAEISDQEVVAMVFLLLVAGHETTTHLISGAVFTLLEDTSRRDWLRADWDRAPLAIEEFLRYVAPVQFSKPRFAVRDIKLGDVQLRRGDMVMAMLVGANLDEATFEAPNELDMARRANRHISFGAGIHFCLGHQLARLEAKSALRALFTQWPNLELACRPDQIKWKQRIGLRAIESLPVNSGSDISKA